MARRAKKKKRKRQTSTEWNLGQPLAFPPKNAVPIIKRLAQEAREEAVRGPFRTKRQKRKK
jgi:hypothetical protein